MNNRQAGVMRETFRKEDKTREQWEKLYGVAAGLVPPPAQQASDLAYGGPPPPIEYTTAEPLGPPIDTMPLDPNAAPGASIYDQAIRISSPRLVDEGDLDLNNTVTRKVIRQVEIPYQRRVKVPVKTRKIVPTRVQKKVRTKKLVEVPSWKMVDENYTVIEEVPAVRQKEIWVKKIVPEKYMKKVEVQKTRQVKVPTTVINEVDDYEIVEVGGSKVVEVDGYRVDEVEDSKLLEVEEYQPYELRPFATGRAQLAQAREIGPVRNFHHSRRIGNEVYHVQDERVREVDEDSVPDDVQRSSVRTAGMNIIQNQGRFAVQATRSEKELSSTFPGLATAQRVAPVGRIGFRVRDGQSNGMVVFKVQAGEPAERAGVQVGDVITYVNNRPTRVLAEFRAAVNNSTGPLLLQVRRRGVQKLMLTVHR